MNDYTPPHHHLKDRVILVTGAGSGVGLVAARAFAAQGATVILLGRKIKPLEAAYDAIETAGGPTPLIFQLNLEKAGEDEFNGLAEGIHQQLGRLDGILHNASRFDNLSPLEIQTMEQFNGMLRTNVVAPFALTRACLPLLKRAPDASVLFTSVSAVHPPAPFWGVHAVSRSAVETLATLWAQELEPFPHLRINVIVPGPVQCRQRRASHPGEVHGKLPQPEAIMPLYLYLMGHDSAGITGQVFEAQKPL